MGVQTEAAKIETEIKVWVRDRAAFEQALAAAGLRIKTPETLERNVLYDTADRRLRSQKQLLRVREYGSRCVLTHKAPPAEEADGTYKRRIETEIAISSCEGMGIILERLDLKPVFIYEKRRTEWADGTGEVVVDATPIGVLAELEGPPEWIDATAARLGIPREEYMTDSYGTLFLRWREETGSSAENMTFAEVGLPAATGPDGTA